MVVVIVLIVGWMVGSVGIGIIIGIINVIVRSIFIINIVLVNSNKNFCWI